MMGENSKSTALGVESVRRKVRGERHRVATRANHRFHFRLSRFRNTFQNPGVADLDFSPVGNERQYEAQPCTWARDRIIGHGFCGGSGLVSVEFDLLDLPQISVFSVVKKNQDAEATFKA